MQHPNTRQEERQRKFELLEEEEAQRRRIVEQRARAESPASMQSEHPPPRSPARPRRLGSVIISESPNWTEPRSSPCRPELAAARPVGHWEENNTRGARLNEFCVMLCVCICAALTAGPSLGIDVKVALCATLAVLSGEFKLCSTTSATRSLGVPEGTLTSDL